MSNTTQIEKSFLNRAPKFIAEGKTIEEAIRLAYEEELVFCCEMQNGYSDRSQRAREVVSRKVYSRFNNSKIL